MDDRSDGRINKKKLWEKQSKVRVVSQGEEGPRLADALLVCERHVHSGGGVRWDPLVDKFSDEARDDVAAICGGDSEKSSNALESQARALLNAAGGRGFVLQKIRRWSRGRGETTSSLMKISLWFSSSRVKSVELTSRGAPHKYAAQT